MKRNKLAQMILLAVVAVVVVIVGATLATRYIYNQALKPVGTSQKLTVVTIETGSFAKQIADTLKDLGLIRESWAFQWYVRNNGLIGELKAGTYALNQNQGIAQIADIIAQGEVATDLVTILPGQRLDQIEAALINSGFTPAEVEAALSPSLYKDHPALVDKPEKANLEGYLYPESFQKTADTTAQDIVRASLDEMQKRLTPSTRSAIAKQGLSIHEGIILASMVEQEVSTPKDRALVAGVFLNRLSEGMRLESDVTAFYGAYLDDATPSVGYDSPHNTYLHDGLPKGPISNVSAESLKAVARPTKSDYFYFVAGDDGNTYYSKTLSEHEENVAAHCKKLCE